jgi:hypothetical protein
VVCSRAALGPRSRRRFNLLPRHGGVDASYAEESFLQPNGIFGDHTLRLPRTFQPTGSTCAEILITEYGLDLIPRFADVGVVSCSWLFLAECLMSFLMGVELRFWTHMTKNVETPVQNMRILGLRVPLVTKRLLVI